MKWTLIMKKVFSKIQVAEDLYQLFTNPYIINPQQTQKAQLDIAHQNQTKKHTLNYTKSKRKKSPKVDINKTQLVQSLSHLYEPHL
jgi:hypothetical protein